MGSWKQLRSEINIASCIVLTGRLSGRRVAYCNRITDTLDKGKALSFSISSTFRSAPCTAAAAGVMYDGERKKKCIQNRVHASTRLRTPSGDTNVTPLDQKNLRSPADISRKHVQEAQPSRLHSGFYLFPLMLHWIKRRLSLCLFRGDRARIHIRKKINLKQLNDLQSGFQLESKKRREMFPESTLVSSTLMWPVLSATSWMFRKLARKRGRGR